MRTSDIIAAKRDGRELGDGLITQLILDYSAGSVPDYQMSAFLMAAFIRGLSYRETLALTRAMVESGSMLKLSAVTGTKLDKHSTGGVGDKTTLVVVPILAACGLKVPKMSGRGLGFTGGTLDKLESIPGFRTNLTVEQFESQVERIGAAIAGQTSGIVPADKKIYALRDVTATVDSLPLIAASVMSKKIACGSDVIVLDVKAGSGAFMKNRARARDLASMMISIGQGFRRTVGAAITSMDQPLGDAVGNSLEVSEAVDTLRGGGPSDFRLLCVQLSAIALDIAGHCASDDDGARMAESVLASGSALDVFRRIVEAQGGDPRVVDDPSMLPRAVETVEVRSRASGVVERIDCERIGRAAGVLGAGRERKEDGIDPAVGIVVRKKLGEPVKQGEPLAVIHANDPARVPGAKAMVLESYSIGAGAETPPLVYEVLR